jgi:type I restriction enzyme S subunit
MKAWQGSLAISNYQGIVSPAYYVCKIKNQNIDKDYLHFYLRNLRLVEKYKQISSGMRIGQWDMAIEDFMAIKIAIPENIQEQKDIVSKFQKKCKDIDLLIMAKEKKLNKLIEYKQSIIYEYVTGKKEV